MSHKISSTRLLKLLSILWGCGAPLRGRLGTCNFLANGKRLATGALIRSVPVVFANTLKFDEEDSCEGLLVIRHEPEGNFIEERKIVTLEVPVRFKH